MSKEKPTDTTEAKIGEELAEAAKRAQQAPKIEGDLSSFLNKNAAQATPSGQIVKPAENQEGTPESPLQSQETPPQAPQKKSYVKTIEEEKRKLEAEKQELTTKINDLSTQLSKAKTQKEIESILQERDALVKEREESIARLSDENKQLKSKVTLYDLQEDPDFHREYIEPINAISQSVMEMIEGNEGLHDQLVKVATMNNAWLSAKTPEERRKFADNRDQIISEIEEELPAFRRGIFNSHMRDFINLSRKKTEALANHEQKLNEYRQRRKEIEIESQQKVRETWSGAFKEVSSVIEKEVEVSPEIKSYMEANGIQGDTMLDEEIASAMITDGAAKYDTKEVARIIKQGAKFRAAQAQIKALQKMLEEKEETIKQFTNSHGPSSGQAQQQGERKGLDTFFSRFKAPAGV